MASPTKLKEAINQTVILLNGGRKMKAYVLKNGFGHTTLVFGLEAALEAYENECRFSEFCGLYDAETGETIAESF